MNDVPGCDTNPGRYPPDEPGFAIPEDTLSFFSGTYLAARNDEFPVLIERIRTDASMRYGDGYDRPDPLGRVVR
jgi:hypothetical protein